MSDGATGQAERQDRAPGPGRSHRYTAALANELEAKWQAAWEERAAFVQPNPGDPGFDASRPKFYCLDMFPYPSGAGLHVGHPEGYTATDIVCRYKRMKGFNVLHPMGWDAFGLPAEQYAIQTGIHPAETTRKSIDTFRRQLKRFGFSYDWSREFGTIDPEYYKWTQWIFLQLYDAWFDVGEGSGRGRARPIRELVEEFESGARDPRLNPRAAEYAGAGDLPDGVSAGPWASLDEETRRAIVDSYRLAYISEQTVNWCPKLGTALANEEVIDGKSERGSFPVFRKPLRQWMFRITAYADRLLEDLDRMRWPESTKIMQREWIGRSEGAEIDFPVVDGSGVPTGESLRVFTTRPDTIFGATYMVVAPEHPLVEEALAMAPSGTDAPALERYVRDSRNRSDVERQEAKEKTGVFTGFLARNPATEQTIQVWTSDYVLMGYGTGAIMAVPGQDQRDWDFAKAFDLPIVRTVQPPEGFDGEAYTGEGPAINSGFLDGLGVAEAKAKIIDWLEERGAGARRVNYKLRDWLFSRQRYWGEPFPIVYDERGRHFPVGESALPVVLPPLDDYAPEESDEPKPLLAKADDWVNVTAGEAGVDPSLLPPDAPVRRETNTMPGWAGSCWYYLRYCDPRNDDRFVSREAERYWMLTPAEGVTSAEAHSLGTFNSGVHRVGGVDLYIGGAEHAVLHLLYARFWHKVLFDLGEVSTPEPFDTLFHQGLILSHAYQRADKTLAPTDRVWEARYDAPRGGGFASLRPPLGGEVTKHVDLASLGPIAEQLERDGVAFLMFGDSADLDDYRIDDVEVVTQIVAKMSKSLKNVVNPDEIIEEFGADTFRLYEMYLGPLDASKPWNTRDVPGLFRFLQRAWRVGVDEETGGLRLADEPSEELERALHRTIAKVTGDIERLAFNTAIAAMIEFVNAATSADKGEGSLTADQLDRFSRVLAPFAPHLAEEVHAKLASAGHVGGGFVTHASWPEWDDAMLVDDTIEIPVQVKGKVRARITVAADADQAELERLALADAKVQEHLGGKPPRKVIVVPGKMVNVVPG